jgi:cytochrome c553
VILKQLTDIRGGVRENALMAPYAAKDRIGGEQSLSDVAGYIDTLEISVDTQKGPGEALGEGRRLYEESCSRCHGARAEGDAEARVPRLQSQHYSYLVRQFEAIRDGQRLNAHPEMKSLIQTFDEAAAHAVLDYVSRLEPPEEFQAPPGWRNPDFSD